MFANENFLVLEGINKSIDGSEIDSVQVAKAKATIVLSLDLSLFIHVNEATAAKEVWDELKDLYENKGFMRKIGLLRILISLKLESSSSMEEYVNQVIETSQKLGRTGLNLDTLVGSLLLARLPERFAHSCIDITIDSIKHKLLDTQVDGATRDSSPASAFAGKTKNHQKRHVKQRGNHRNRTQNKNKHKSSNKNDIICYKCKESGHYMSQCSQNYNKNSQSN